MIYLGMLSVSGFKFNTVALNKTLGNPHQVFASTFRMYGHVTSTDAMLELILHLVWKRFWEEDLSYQITALKAKLGATKQELCDRLSTFAAIRSSVLARPRNHGEETRQVIETRLEYLQHALNGHVAGISSKHKPQSVVPIHAYRFDREIQRTTRAIDDAVQQSAGSLRLRSLGSAKDNLSVSSVASGDYSLLEPWDPSMSLASDQPSIASVLNSKKKSEAQIQPSIPQSDQSAQVTSGEGEPTSWWIPSLAQERRMSRPRFNSQDDGVCDPLPLSTDIGSLSGETLAGSSTSGSDRSLSLSTRASSLGSQHKRSRKPSHYDRESLNDSGPFTSLSLRIQSLDPTVLAATEFAGNDGRSFTNSHEGYGKLHDAIFSWARNFPSGPSIESQDSSSLTFTAPPCSTISAS